MRKMWVIVVILVMVAGVVVVKEWWKGETITVIVPTQTSIPANDSESTEIPIKSVLIEVPYTVQAPSGQWGDERFQDACEEVNAIMAIVAMMELPITNNQLPIKDGVINKAYVEKEVLMIEDYEEKNYKSAVDTSVEDTAERIIKGYYNYQKVEVKPVNSTEDVVRELVMGKIVITPMNGQVINNPHYKQPGPARHMILVKGYDAAKKEFITNDSGMKDGGGYRYPEKVFFNGIRDYPSGDHVPIVGVVKKMIVVSR